MVADTRAKASVTQSTAATPLIQVMHHVKISFASYRLRVYSQWLARTSLIPCSLPRILSRQAFEAIWKAQVF